MSHEDSLRRRSPRGYTPAPAPLGTALRPWRRGSCRCGSAARSSFRSASSPDGTPPGDFLFKASTRRPQLRPRPARARGDPDASESDFYSGRGGGRRLAPAPDRETAALLLPTRRGDPAPARRPPRPGDAGDNRGGGPRLRLRASSGGQVRLRRESAGQHLGRRLGGPAGVGDLRHAVGLERRAAVRRAAEGSLSSDAVAGSHRGGRRPWRH